MILVKYADDTNLLVPAHTDLDLTREFSHIKHWAAENKMVINLHKTKEIVFRHPNPKLFVYPDPLDHVHQVSCAKLLGVTFKDNFQFDAHINNILKLCSQRLYLLKLLPDEGIPPQNLNMNIIFDSLILSRLQYALPAWSGFLSADSVGTVNSLLKRAFKYGYTVLTPDTHLRHSVMTLMNVFLERYIMNITVSMISYHHYHPTT